MLTPELFSKSCEVVMVGDNGDNGDNGEGKVNDTT